MSPLPDGKVLSVPKGRRWHHLPWRNPRQNLTLTIRYMGGSEGVMRIETRGSSGEFSGSDALFDVMREIWQWDRKPPGFRAGNPRPDAEA